jgi:Na+/melibiose symporter-like transporter
MADDLDALRQDERPVPARRRTWPLALGATVVILALLMWITHELVEWWAAEIYCGWFLC